jgi:permease MlaE
MVALMQEASVEPLRIIGIGNAAPPGAKYILIRAQEAHVAFARAVLHQTPIACETILERSFRQGLQQIHGQHRNLRAIDELVGAIQLRRLGSEIYVSNLIGVIEVREMAPLISAIVMSGRTGRAYAADGWADGRLADSVCWEAAHLLITPACTDARFRSVAVFVALTTVMPCVLVIIPMVLAIIVAFAWRNDAARCNHDQPQQEAAFDNVF